MRRLMYIAAFALLLSVPVWAQRGGGHAGGGHGGFGGGHSGGFGGRSGGFGGHMGGGGFSHGGTRGFSRGGARGFTHSPGISRNFSRGPFLHNGFRGRNGFHDRDRFRFRFRNNCFGFGCWGSPWWGVGYYDPWLWDWWDSDSSYDDDYNNNLAIAAEMNRQSLEEQRMLRQEQDDGDQDAYAGRYARPRRSYNSDQDAQSNAQNQAKSSPMFSDTILVFRDKHQEEVENYAIVGDTLWNFAPQHTQKISLADLDLAATQKANEDRGTTFRVPSGS